MGKPGAASFVVVPLSQHLQQHRLERMADLVQFINEEDARSLVLKRFEQRPVESKVSYKFGQIGTKVEKNR